MIEKPSLERLGLDILVQIFGCGVLINGVLQMNPAAQLFLFPLFLWCLPVAIKGIVEEYREKRDVYINQLNKMKQDKTITIRILDHQEDKCLYATGSADPDIVVSELLQYNDPDDVPDRVMEVIKGVNRQISDIVKADPEKYPEWQSIGTINLDVTVTDTEEVEN